MNPSDIPLGRYVARTRKGSRDTFIIDRCRLCSDDADCFTLKFEHQSSSQRGGYATASVALEAAKNDVTAMHFSEVTSVGRVLRAGVGR